MKFITLQSQDTLGNIQLTGIYKVIKEISINNQVEYLYISCIDNNDEFLIPSLNDNLEEHKEAFSWDYPELVKQINN